MTSYAHILLSNPAPRAEVVPGMGQMTVADLLTFLDDGFIYEVVDGVLVRVAGSGRRATTKAVTISLALGNFVLPRRLGIVTGADGVYPFPGAETGLIPDVGFYLAARDASIPEADRDKPIPFAPDLAVEVATPGQQAEEMAAKARLYLSGGTRLVWSLWPASGQIDVWRPHRVAGPAAPLNTGDMLEGEDVVPGFAHPVAAVFADPVA